MKSKEWCIEIINKFDETMLKSEFPLTLRDKILETIFEWFKIKEEDLK